jgi:hypothetical protein
MRTRQEVLLGNFHVRPRGLGAIVRAGVVPALQQRLLAAMQAESIL